MKVKILKVETSELVDALIREGKQKEMPSIHDGWKFNFDKRLKKLKNATGYLLVKEDTPEVAEGCIIFQMIDKVIPYMAYVEVAPHNKKEERVHDYVAGCLIAFAYRLSLIEGKEHYRGLLYFDVMEEKEEDQNKLMALYSKKYNAKWCGETTMQIADEDGDKLVETYLSVQDKQDNNA